MVLTTPARSSPGLPPVPTRLLIVLPPRPVQAGLTVLPSLLDTLQPLFNRGWQVALLSPATAFTGYVSKGAALLQPHATLTAPSYEQAIATLQTFPGRRLVFYASDGSGTDSRRLRSSARAAEAMLYDIGGDPWDNYTYDGGTDTGPASVPISGAGLYGAYPGPADGTLGMTIVDPTPTYTFSTLTPSIDDLHAERSIRAAIHDALRDAGNYYDLRLEVPAATPSLALTLSVPADYRITAQPGPKATTPPLPSSSTTRIKQDLTRRLVSFCLSPLLLSLLNRSAS